MKYFFDAEFIENGRTIDLISIGVIAEDGREYYACNGECDLSKANDWVKENVLPNLPRKHPMLGPDLSYVSSLIASYSLTWKPPTKIAEDLIDFCHTQPVFWGEFPSYDWVAFCQLFGTMADLPQGFPMRCNDVIQLAEHMGYTANNLPPSLETEGNHNALLGARTVKARYDWLMTKAHE